MKNIWGKLNKKVIVTVAVVGVILLAVAFVVYAIIPKHNVFVKGPDLHYPHSGPAVLLQDGRVLITGGMQAEAEIYDPKIKKFLITGKMNYVRESGHTATLLKNGKVLIVGGKTSTKGVKKRKGNIDVIIYKGGLKSYPASEAEIYDPEIGTFTVINSMKVPRYYHTATLLPNGNVLIIGGSAGSDNGFAMDIEEFNPEINEFTIVGKMDRPNLLHNSVLLPNNKVLITGEPDNNAEYFAKIYDLKKKEITKLIKIRNSHCDGTATLLNNGNVLITGGRSGGGAYNIKYATLYNINTSKFIDIPSLNTGRGYHTATLLPNGKVLIIGGQAGQSAFMRNLADAEIYDPETSKFGKISSRMDFRRSRHESKLLKSGNVLIFGGSSYNGSTLSSELYLY